MLPGHSYRYEEIADRKVSSSSRNLLCAPHWIG